MGRVAFTEFITGREVSWRKVGRCMHDVTSSTEREVTKGGLRYKEASECLGISRLKSPHLIN